jgi:hypothetical protein
MPGGSQLPLTHVPPPRLVNGSAPTQVPEPPDGGGGGGFDGGYQLPFEHVPPPRLRNGSDVLQPVDGGGAGFAGGAGAGVPIDGAGDTGIPGGYQLPFAHVPPPRLMNGSDV